jgi:putative transposase
MTYRVRRGLSGTGLTERLPYIWTLEGWLYLAVLIDLYSRLVVGWSTSTSLHRDIALEALQMATTRRKPPSGCIHHTDRGSQCWRALKTVEI